MGTCRITLDVGGVSGAILDTRFLEALQSTNIETHLIMSEWAEKAVVLETEYTAGKVKTLVSAVYTSGDMAAHIPGGSLLTDGIVVRPCSMKALTAIASSFSHSLITRCADVSLKEGRRLFLVPREILLSVIHLKSLLKLSRLGVKALPPCMRLYTKPRTIEEIASHLTGKIFDVLEAEDHIYRRWGD